MKKPPQRDNVYATHEDMIVDFVFDERVARVFPDMIRRSVPGYDTIIPLLGVFAEKYAQPDSHVYDLGCSLGAVSLAMQQRITRPGCRIMAVDNAPAMVEQCRLNTESVDTRTPVEVVCSDITQIDFMPASLVVINFTLQFLQPEQRLPLVKKIYQALLPGGALIICDKIKSDETSQAFYEAMHEQFKRANGYSDLEISQKRSALEHVLIPDTLEVHHQRLQDAGFMHTFTWFQCFNFAGLCAVR